MKTQQVEGRKDKPCRLHTLLATDRWESQVIFWDMGPTGAVVIRQHCIRAEQDYCIPMIIL